MLIQARLSVPMCPKQAASADDAPVSMFSQLSSPKCPIVSTKPCHLRGYPRQAPVSHPVQPAGPHSSASLTSQICPCLCGFNLLPHPTPKPSILPKGYCESLLQGSCLRWALISCGRVKLFFFLSQTEHVCQEDSLLKGKLFKTLITMNMSLSFIPIRSESRERLDTLLGGGNQLPQVLYQKTQDNLCQSVVCYLELTLHFEVNVFLKLLLLPLLFCIPRDGTQGSCLLG